MSGKRTASSTPVSKNKRKNKSNIPASRSDLPSADATKNGASVRSTESVKPAGAMKKASSHQKRWRIVFIVAAIVLVGALIAFGALLFSYAQGQQKYNQLAEKMNIQADDKTSQVQEFTLESMTVDWEALKQTNPDTVAWIYVPHTKINYPIVQGQDNSYYVSHDFDGDQGLLTQFGAIFMDSRNNPDWFDAGYFFYGHHMNDGSMFAAIAQMADQKAFDDARIIYLLTPDGNFKLRSFALLDWSADDSLVQTRFDTEKEMIEYVTEQIDRSIVDPGKIPDVRDIKKFFAFVTCNSYTSGRYVLYSYIEETTVPDVNIYD